MSLHRVVASAAPRQLSDSALQQVVLSYRAAKHGAVEQGWKPKPGFVYTTVRAISARVNQNFDAWPSEELKESYRTFIGKPVFVNHLNSDPERARGKVIAARYIESGKDKYVDTVMETDAQRYPKLAKVLLDGSLDSVSMGVECKYTKCSVPSCRKLAHDESEFCDHVANHKGKVIRIRNAKTGRMEDHRVYEDCYKLSFFELSYVFEPADETAVASRVMMAGRQGAREDWDLSLLGPGYEKDLERLRSWPTDHDDEGPVPLSELERKEMHVRRHAVSTDDDDENGPIVIDDSAAQPTGSDSDIDYSQYAVAPPVPVFPEYSSGSGSSSGNSAGGSVGTSAGGSSGGSANGLVPAAADMRGKLRDMYPGADIGGYNPNADQSWDEHQTGKALDFMTGDNIDEGNSVKDWALDNGANYVIWQQHLWRPDGTGYDMEDRGSPTENHRDHVHINTGSRHLAYGETEVPQDIDTLRNDENDTLDDYQFVDPVELRSSEDDEIPFQHYLQSPPELLGPNLDHVEHYDQEQEAEGLDQDRLVENYGEIDGDPDFEDVPPRRNTMARTRTAAPRKRTAADEDAIEALEEALGEDLDHDNEQGEDPDHAEVVLGDDDGDSDDDGTDDEDEDSDDVAVDADGDGDVDAVVDQDGDDGDAPPWATARDARARRSANRRRRTRNKGQRGAAMNVATRGRRRTAEDNGYTDGGPYGRNDQGEDAEAFITQTPDTEAVEAPADGDSPISNTEGNLVASIQRSAAETQRLLARYQRMQAAKKASARPYRATADFVLSLPAAQRPAMAQHFAKAFAAENPRFSSRKFFAAVGLRTADAVEEPTVVDPALSGTDDQAVKGDDFDSVALDDVETQPKDASLKVFAAFDAWLRKATGRTASQHNPEWLRRQAARWAAAQGIEVKALYPTLGKALRQARKGDTSTGKAAMNRRRANDESLDVAAPQARIDVEAPVANDTDAEAQASQYDLGDFAHNAGDDIADPDLDSDSQIWAPGEGDKTAKKASGIAAVRYAESFINAGLAPATDRWKIAKQAETMTEAFVIDRTRLLEAVVANNAARRPVVPQGPSIPRGTATARTAARQVVAANDTSNDSALFF